MSSSIEQPLKVKNTVGIRGLETKRELARVARDGYVLLDDFPRGSRRGQTELLRHDDPTRRVRAQEVTLPEPVYYLPDREIAVIGVQRVLFERHVAGGLYVPTERGIRVRYYTPELEKHDSVLLGASGRTFIAGENGPGTEQYSTLSVDLTVEECREPLEKPTAVAVDYNSGVIVADFVVDALRAVGVNPRAENLTGWQNTWANLIVGEHPMSDALANLAYRVPPEE